MNLKSKIQKLEKELADAHREEENRCSRQKFQCSCGKMHQIRQCVVIQTHWYVRPYGCMEGDYWNEGELRIVCPKTSVRNRVLFDDPPWEHRNEYKFNAEMQFSRKYKHLFKEVVDDYEKDDGEWANNEYFDNNHKKFGIEIAKNEKE